MNSLVSSPSIESNLRALVIALLHGPFLLPGTRLRETRGTNSQYEKSVSVAAEEEEEEQAAAAAAAAVMTPSPYGAPSH